MSRITAFQGEIAQAPDVPPAMDAYAVWVERQIRSLYAAIENVQQGFGGLLQSGAAYVPGSVGPGVWTDVEWSGIQPGRTFRTFPDVASNTITLGQGGPWLTSFTLSVQHNDAQQGRSIDIRFNGVGDNAPETNPLTYGVARNTDYTNMVGTFLIDLEPGQVGVPWEMQIGNVSAGDSLTLLGLSGLWTMVQVGLV